MNDFRDRLTRHVEEGRPDHPPSFGNVLARRAQRRNRRRTLAVSGTAMVAVAAVAIGTQLSAPDRSTDPGGPATNEPSPTESQRPKPTYEWADKPAPVVLRLPDRDLQLDLWSYCWTGPVDDKGISSGICSDGFARTADLDSVGSPETVAFWFGMPGWDFEATFEELGADCPRQHTVQAASTGARTFRLDPGGPAGRYRVNLFGQGKPGSVSTSFVWTTPQDGPSQQPAGHLAVVTDDDGGYTSYGVELGISDLAFQPRQASAEVTVTSATGASTTFEPRLDERAADECHAEGSLFFANRDMEGVTSRVTALGDAPFDYRVVLTVDGQEYVGSAVWPRDEMKDEAPNTVLRFEPPLPAYEDG